MSQFVTRKIPVTAFQWIEGQPWVEGMVLFANSPVCMTKNGPVPVNSGDWIMHGDGEFYPCPDEVFKKTYVRVPQTVLNSTIENNFMYHPPKEGQPEQYEAIREKAKELAYLIEQEAPNSREKSLAMTNLEQSVFWANAAIARNDKPPAILSNHGRGA